MSSKYKDKYRIKSTRFQTWNYSWIGSYFVTDKYATQNQFGPQRKNLASIIRGFKSAVTKQARIINPYFTWQSRFYDRIIRNEKEFY